MLTFTTRDQYLSIQGAREAFQEAKKSYEAFGKGENLVMVEDDFKHWMTPKIGHPLFVFPENIFNSVEIQLKKK
jgi:hypothetical protein